MSLQQWVTSQANPEIPVNENFEVLGNLAVYGRDPTTTTGLTWGFNGGRWSGFAVSDGTVTLAASNTNYLTVERATGVLSASTSTTNWNDTANHARAYLIVTGTTTVTSFQDHRVGGNGVFSVAAPLAATAIPQNSQSAAYTLVLADAGRHILHPSADTTARTFTIPANSSVAFPIGTVITFVNQNGAGVVTIAITTDTMRLAGAGTTGSRTLAANGIATAIKLTATEWIISGTGLT